VLYQAELHPEPRAIIHLDTIVGQKSNALWAFWVTYGLQNRLGTCWVRITIQAAAGS